MPKISDHPNITRVKLLWCGDPGAGKTGSLATLANAGFNVNIIDIDNNLAILRAYLTDEAAKCVSYVTIPAKDPQTWNKAVALLDKWDDGVDPKTWDANTVFVVDSGTFLNEALMTNLCTAKGIKLEDAPPQALWGSMYKVFENFIAKLTSDKYKCHVIVTAHLRNLEDDRGLKKSYPSFMGQQLPNTVARYMNNVWLAETKDGKRSIVTQSTNTMSLKSSAPHKLDPKEAFDLGAAFKKMGA